MGYLYKVGRIFLFRSYALECSPHFSSYIADSCCKISGVLLLYQTGFTYVKYDQWPSIFYQCSWTFRKSFDKIEMICCVQTVFWYSHLDLGYPQSGAQTVIHTHTWPSSLLLNFTRDPIEITDFYL